MKFRYIVFDLDGTLLDTLKDLNEACNFALNKYNFQMTTLSETKSFIGNGIRNLVLKSLKGNDKDIDLVFDAFKDYYFKNYNVYTKPYEGIVELLNILKMNNCRLAVVSNKNQYCLDKLCEEHFKDVFEIIIGDSDKIERKPSTMGLEMVCKKFSCSLADLLYIGDSGVDFQTVKNAKCNGIYCAYGFKGREFLESINAEIIVDNALEILEYLEV